MITYKEFEVIRSMLKNESNCTPQKIFESNHYYVFHSVEEVADLIVSLEKKGYIANHTVTQEAMDEIATLRVENAVILAAGGADISAKSVYSVPKGLFMKNGETLIERQIRQLREAGIQDITVVIAYKQELYFFLQDKWGVNLEINPDLKKNSIFSLYVAKNHLGSTYICSCDNYFEDNPFSEYEYNTFHATVYKDDAHNELSVRKNASGRILGINNVSKSGECIYGHAYIDKTVSHRLIKFLEEEIDNFQISSLFWEEFAIRHAEDLDIYVREYDTNYIEEFDSIQSIQNIEGLFLGSVSKRINEKICEVLDCKEDEINHIVVLEKGLTNILFTFVVRGERYIFRYPGESSQFFIERKSECVAQKLAKKAGVDDTCVYIDESGIKISKYRENCYDLHGVYYEDVELMKGVARKIKAFHDAGYDIENLEEYEYDPIYQCERLFKEASKVKGNLLQIFEKEWNMMRKLQKYADMDGVRHTMCHNDINADNVLLTDTTLEIIDWEYARCNDPGYDFGRVIAGLEYEADEPKIMEILEAYFGRPATETEHLHWMAYSAIHNWHYFGWCLYKESINESTRDWMLFFYRQVKKLADWCLTKYEEKYGKI